MIALSRLRTARMRYYPSSKRLRQSRAHRSDWHPRAVRERELRLQLPVEYLPKTPRSHCPVRHECSTPNNTPCQTMSSRTKNREDTRRFHRSRKSNSHQLKAFQMTVRPLPQRGPISLLWCRRQVARTCSRPSNRPGPMQRGHRRARAPSAP